MKTIVLSVVTAALCAGCLRAPSASAISSAVADDYSRVGCATLTP